MFALIIVTCNMFFYLLDRLFEMCIRVFFPWICLPHTYTPCRTCFCKWSVSQSWRCVAFKFLTWMFSSIQYVIYCSFLGAYMSNKEFECPQCCKRYKNAGGLKTHMKTHKKPKPKSGSMLRWVVKRAKSEIKPRPSMAIESKPIMRTRQLKLRKSPVREPTHCCYKSTRSAYLVGRNNHRLMLVLLWLLHSWPILILPNDHPNFESLTSSTSKRWNQNLREARRVVWHLKSLTTRTMGRNRSSLSARLLAMRIRTKGTLISKNYLRS